MRNSTASSNAVAIHVEANNEIGRRPLCPADLLIEPEPPRRVDGTFKLRSDQLDFRAQVLEGRSQCCDTGERARTLNHVQRG